jgi:hypothetical protein
MVNLLLSILGKSKNIFALAFGSMGLFIFLRIIPQFHIIYNVWLLKEVSWVRKVEVLYQYSFGSFSLWDWFDTSATIILTLVTIMNIIVLSIYFKRQRNNLNKKSLAATSLGMLLGMFGVGCVSCGALILAPLLSTLGILGALELLPFFGKELVVIGVCFVIGSTMYLLYQLKKPLIC